MDRERDRDAAQELIQEHDEKEGGGEPERVRPGQGDAASRPIDGAKPPPDAETGRTEKSHDDAPPPSPDPGPFAPH